MIIERFFGKGRAARAISRRPQGEPVAAEAPMPPIEATDAPASLARTGTAPPPIAVASLPQPSIGAIAARAYELWESQGRPDGRERDNWIEAERQLCTELASRP
jgi:hypothetical protein